MPRRRKPSGRGYQKRRINFREPLQRFLIVCEGEKTEPAYFDGFRVPRVVINIVGLGKDPISLIERAIHERRNGEFDQAWCVFDRDEVPLERFNLALDRANQNKIKVAYSNQAFELWYLLHFRYCDAALSRGDYADRVGKHLGRKYQKNDRGLYGQLLSRQADAIQNAERLLEQYDRPDPANDDPSTTVHELVKELNRFVRR